MIVLSLDSERGSGEVPCMPEELEVAAEVEVEEIDEIEEIEERVVTKDQEEINVTKKKEIKWRHRPLTPIIDTSFENPLIYERDPMSPYFRQYISDEIFNLMMDNTNIYALQMVHNVSKQLVQEKSEP